jgi:hypothetical protein
MKSTLQQLISKNKDEEKAYASSREAEINNPETSTNSRNFLKKTALGGIALGGLMNLVYRRYHCSYYPKC